MSGQEVLKGIIKDISYHGDAFKLDVALGDEVLKVKVARERGAGIERGQPVVLTWKAGAAKVLPPAQRGDGGDGGDGDSR
jgi:TOBE domain